MGYTGNGVGGVYALMGGALLFYVSLVCFILRLPRLFGYVSPCALSAMLHDFFVAATLLMAGAWRLAARGRSIRRGPPLPCTRHQWSPPEMRWDGSGVEVGRGRGWGDG